jgi:heme/copper-type cytochrome/quinol oxidase subunit 1
LHLIYYFGGQWMTFIPLFWVGYSGLPRRVHDYPAIFMGWQSMATVGHFITLVGIIFFFLMLVDSHYENKIITFSTLGIPRWHKRILYYLFKIRYIQHAKIQLIYIPNKKVRHLLSQPYFSEYEKFY